MPDIAEIRAAYERDGVTVVRGAFAPWSRTLLPRALELIADAQNEERKTSERVALKFLWRTEPRFRDFAFNSPAAALAAEVTGSGNMRLAMDQLWAKAPRSRHVTRWHFDRPAWPVTGMMLPSIWVALTPVTPENSLVFVAGSHLAPRDPQDHAFIDFQSRRDDPSLKYLSFDLRPGDALIFHPLAYHWCAGNTDGDWRVVLTTRWLGDDIFYDPARSYLDEGLSFEGCKAGGPLAGPEFPLVNFDRMGAT